MRMVCDLADVTLAHINQVGGKAASLGEMIQALTSQGIRIPQGFVITADAYRAVLDYNKIADRITNLLQSVDYEDRDSVHRSGQAVRDLLAQVELPPELEKDIRASYQALSAHYHTQQVAVAVRSSATAEDLPTASFAGQQETYLNVKGEDALLKAYRYALASLFTDRAIVYRFYHHIVHDTVALAVCVQKMVNTNNGSAGVIFTLDPESGFRDVCAISAIYGLGELLVQGTISADEYMVYKKVLAHHKLPIIQTRIGSKDRALLCTDEGTVTTVVVPEKQKLQRVLSEDEMRSLAEMAITIESYYTQQRGVWTPMDIEWAKDGEEGLLYIVQARPETVHSARAAQAGHELIRYYLEATDKERSVIVQGQSIGQAIIQGTARIIGRPEDAHNVQKGDIIVTRMTDPDWVPFMRKAAGIVTDLGGRTCHAAIVSRELGIPAVVGTGNGTQKIKDSQTITLDCSQGLEGTVYEGALQYSTRTISLKQIPHISAKVLVNIAQPEGAFQASLLPVSGVGLARLEFIMLHSVGIHPMVVTHPERIQDRSVFAALTERIKGYADTKDYFITRLSEGIGTIAAAFYPRPVIIRLSDLKSNEYRNLLGGEWFEPEEENPMLGWRGASRYTSKDYQPAFALECEALRRVRDEWGFSNAHLMVPFVRSVAELSAVGDLLTKYGLIRGNNGLLWYMMVELPVNVILLEQFAPLCDGFSIGSNDLTQLTLGVDRDSGFLRDVFDERSEAVKLLIREAICKAHKAKKPISICGEAPSNYPEFAEFLLQEGIDAISLSPDAVLPFLMR